MWMFNFFLLERTLKQEMQGKKTSGSWDQGEFDNHALLLHQAALHIFLITPTPLHLLLLLHPPPSPPPEGPPGPPSFPTGTCRSGTGMPAYRPGLFLPAGSKIMTGFKEGVTLQPR